MNIRASLALIFSTTLFAPLAFAEPMFSANESAHTSDENDGSRNRIGAFDFQFDPDDFPGGEVATEGPRGDENLPNELASNVQVLNINRDAYFGQLQRMGWRDYGVETATEPPSIMLADNQEVVLENDELVVLGDDNAVLVANAAGTDTQSLLFISGDNVIGGELSADGRFFALRPGHPDPTNSDFTIDAIEVTEWIFHDEAETHAIETDEPGQPEEVPDDAPDGSGTVIDVMVVYPRSLRDRIPMRAVGAEINLAVQYVNLIYHNSGIDQRINLVHFQEIDYEPSGDIDTDLKRLAKDSDGHMDEVFDLWKDKKADIVSLWVGRANHPGVAYTMKQVSTRFAPCAVNVVRWPAAIRNYSFAHELGHNMGARHDIRQTGENLPFPHAHGYVHDQLVTVMAYPKGSCNHVVCRRVANFSNADRELGLLASADNRLTLNKTASVVSQFDTRHDLLGKCDP